MKWIDVKQRLPEDGQEVACRYVGVYSPRIVRFWRDAGGNAHFGNLTNDSGSQPATHWVPFEVEEAELEVPKVHEELHSRIQNYLGNGGLFNPELMEHDKVSALLIDCRDFLSATTPEKLANVFLSWPLPDTVHCDPCASMRGYPNRIGTNLLTAVESRQMFEEVLAKASENHTKAS